MKWIWISGLVFFFAVEGAFSSPLARFEIVPEDLVLPVPLSVDLEGIVSDEAASYVLCRADGEQTIPVSSQVEPGRTPRLWFLPDRPLMPGEKAVFELRAAPKATLERPYRAIRDETAVTLCFENRDIIRYYHALHPVPEGVSPVFRRSGFLHPLWSPAGAVLTRIQPPDHYHHYGIWNPWTRTQIEGRAVDFWNLGEKQGTVRFAGFVSMTSGPVFAGFAARQEHVVLGGEGPEKTAIVELLDVRGSSCVADGRLVWVIDFTSQLQNVLDSPIVLDAYRYGGGIGFRATEAWTKENTLVLTSEGKGRAEADGTRARWCDVRGATGNGRTSGILFLSHSGNRQHPEPMRVWPPEANGGRGDLFFEFCPIRLTSWSLEPERQSVLRYRMIVYDGSINPETAEVLWKNFVRPPLVLRRR